jgi:hypothetical protein
MTAAKPLRITSPKTGTGERIAGRRSAAVSLRDMRSAVLDEAAARNRVTSRKKKTRRR